MTSQKDDILTVVVPVESLVVEDRIRQDLGADTGELRELANSLYQNGQFHPIIVDGKHVRAGVRRYYATALLLGDNKAIGGTLEEGDPRRLPPGHIRVQQWVSLSPLEQLNVEIDENKKRKQFTEAEDALAMKRIRERMEDVLGRKVTKQELAKTLNVSAAHVTMGMTVADAVEKEGKIELLRTSSIRAAYDKLSTASKLKELRERAKKNKKYVGEVQEHMHQGDAVDWLKSLPDHSVDFTNFDPPWGIEVESEGRGDSYIKWDDAKEHFETITVPGVREIYRIQREDTWFAVWYGAEFYQNLVDILRKVGWTVNPVPRYWYKTNKKGTTGQADRVEMNVVETFLLCRKGSPRLYKGPVQNVFPYDMDRRRINYAQKPVPLYLDMLERYTFGDMYVIDPTFGSGNFLKAARKIGRSYDGVELDGDMVDKAILQMLDGEI